MKQGFWARNSWKFLLVLVFVISLFGIGDVVVGVDADPAIPVGITGLTPEEIRAVSEPIYRLIDLQVRAGGLQLIVVSILWSVLVLIPLRRGEKWAWYTLWTFPAWGLAVSVSFLFVELQPDHPPPPPAVSGWVFFALTSLLLWSAKPGTKGALTSARSGGSEEAF